jgi:D-aminoacyl-tRNA deacylase
MRVVLQRVTQGRVLVDGQIVGAVERGYVALVGVAHTDTLGIVTQLAQKTAHLRVFSDDAGKMNRSLLDVGGGVLVVSQFTLYADTRKGRRPSFIDAARPELAAPLVQAYASALQAQGVALIAQGVFGADMLVQLGNDGPVTIILDSAQA